MFDWNDYGHGVYCFDSGYARPELAAIYLLVENGRAAFIDTGSNASVPNAIAALQKVGLDETSVDFVILTHIHLDHAGGAGLMMQKFPNAKLVVHPRGVRHMVEPSKLVAGVTAVYGSEFVQSMYGDILPIAAERIIEAGDNFVLNLNGRELVCIETDGHARHHNCIIDKKSDGIFTGDMFGLSYRETDVDDRVFIFPTTTPSQFDPQAMRRSIDKLVGISPKYMYLTHYGRVTNVAQLSKEFLRHLSVAVDTALYVHGLNLDAAARHKRITDALHAYVLMQLRLFGCSLSDAKIHDVFEGDIALNAQGMEVWLDSLSM
ncbi:MAG: MBL fold metallo-hydrolase [Formosimonas sp.]|jgi:glyoxylase-like metal-dependent hydrolase (beta-lactamase superfamily II)